MSEENRDDIVQTTESEGESGSIPNRRPFYIAAAALSVLVFGLLAFLLLRDRESGQVVPPPRTVTFGDNGRPAETTGEETITIPEDQLEKIGLKIESVGETLSSEAMSVAATGVVQPNAYRDTPVMSVVGGVVRRVGAQLGENVGNGQTVAVIFSDELAAAQSRYLALRTEAQTARQNYERTAKLVRISPVSSAEVDAALATLKKTTAELEEHHKHHERMAKLVKIGAESREALEQATARLQAAEAGVEEARKRYNRAVQVAEINPVSRSEFEQAAVKLQTSESELAMSRQRLLVLGLSDQRVSRLQSPSQISAELPIAAPVSGTVTARSVNPGEVVEANKELMKITNLATVWVIAQVYERDIGQIRTGSGASITSDSYPGQLFRGHVTYIDPNINQETRTAQVRVELENPGQILKIGMYVNVAFGSTGMAERTMPVVPASAVQNMNNSQVVFVATENPGVFIVRKVRMGAEENGRYVVHEGLNVGDRVVTQGSFLLRAELLKQGQANY